MYKAMHQTMRSSEKLAELSDFAYRVWSMGLIASDVVGRITANPRTFHVEAIPMQPYEEAKILVAFNELKKLNLCHFYEANGKPYMVFHDHDEYNKASKNLRHSKSKTPPPPPSLCFCVTYTREEEDQGATTVATVVPTVVATTDVHVPVHVHVPSSVLEGESEGKPRESVRFLASKWNKGPGVHLNGDKACGHIQAAVDVGVSHQALDQAFSDHGAIKGLKIWEVIDPLRPRGGVQMPTMDEIIRSASKVGAK
jgi:hypothetical protein